MLMLELEYYNIATNKPVRLGRLQERLAMDATNLYPHNIFLQDLQKQEN